MRKREEIEKEVKSSRNIPVSRGLILEVLLDIRDLLIGIRHDGEKGRNVKRK